MECVWTLSLPVQVKKGVQEEEDWGWGAAGSGTNEEARQKGQREQGVKHN